MSYLLHEDGERIVDGYPDDVSVILGAYYDKETNKLEPWRGIPRNVDLSTYMRIVPGLRRGPTMREYRVLYNSAVRPHAKMNCPWSVSIALYGFIDSMNLSATGNWDQTLQGASKALQWVKLTGGHFRNPFKEQGLALSSVEQHIIGTLRGVGLPHGDQEAMSRYRQKELKFSRRVFDKVTANTPPSVPITGPAVQISNKWRITSTPKLGYRQEDLQIKSCNAAKFSPGDFVQVVIKLVALVQQNKHNAPVTVAVMFDLLSCILLLPSKDAHKIMPPAVGTPVKPISNEDEIQDAVDYGPEML